MASWNRTASVGLAVAMVVWVLGGCADPEPEADGGNDGTIRFVTPYQVKSLDPATQGLWAPEWGYGELLMRATEDGEVEPWLLEQLTNTEPTEWTLTLRENVTFQNGQPLTAPVLAAVLDRALEDNALLAASLPEATTEVTDDWTVTLTSTEPVANLPNLLADEQGPVIYDPDAVNPDADPASLLDEGIYTGPFEVTALTADEMTLTRNPGYWGDEPALAGAQVRFVPDGQARVLAVRNGEADVALYPPTELVHNPGAGATAATARQPLQQLRAILNTRTTAMADERVRRAFALGIDYRQIADEVLDGLYDAPGGLFPPVAGYGMETQHTDPAEAERLLEQAGWRPDEDGVRTKAGEPLEVTMLTYPQQPDTTTIAVAMQAQLESVGFDVRISEVDSNYEAMEQPDGWDIGLSFDGTLGYTYDPVAPLRDFLTTDGDKNFGGVSDSALDQLVDQLATTIDESARAALLVEAQELIAEHAYTVIVTERAAKAIVGPDFAGYQPSSVLHHLGAHVAAG